MSHKQLRLELNHYGVNKKNYSFSFESGALDDTCNITRNSADQKWMKKNYFSMIKFLMGKDFGERRERGMWRGQGDEQIQEAFFLRCKNRFAWGSK